MTILARKTHNAKYNNKVGIYYVSHPEKTGGVRAFQFKSRLEKAMMCYCDANDKVLRWVYEPNTPIRYEDFSQFDVKRNKYGKPRKYYVDFILTIITPNKLLKTVWVEIKSLRETQQPGINASDMDKQTWIKNNCKWDAARKMCKSIGAEFHIITERELSGKAN